jgi:hypothetical protein
MDEMHSALHDSVCHEAKRKKAAVGAPSHANSVRRRTMLEFRGMVTSRARGADFGGRAARRPMFDIERRGLNFGRMSARGAAFERLSYPE